MKILLTGSSGPKVAATVAARLAGEHDVVGFDLHPAPTTTHVADITRITDWQPYLDGVDAVVRLAALHAPHRATHSPADFIRLNINATASLVESAQRAGAKRFLLASTTSVYGRAMRSNARAVWVTEDLSPIAEDIQDETKLAAESICRDAFAPNFVTAALRFSRSFPEPLPLMALSRLYRDVDARDVAQAFALALGAPLKGVRWVQHFGRDAISRSGLRSTHRRRGDRIDRSMPGAGGGVCPSKMALAGVN